MPDDPRLRELLAVLESFCVPVEVAEIVIEQVYRIGEEHGRDRANMQADLQRHHN